MSDYHQEANKLFTLTESVLKHFLKDDSSQNQHLQRAMIENKCRKLSRENAHNNKLIKNKRLNEVPLEFLKKDLTDYDDIYFFEKWAHHPINSSINHGLDVKSMNLLADTYLKQLDLKQPQLPDYLLLPSGPKGAKSVRFALNEQPTQSSIKDAEDRSIPGITSHPDNNPTSKPLTYEYNSTRESLDGNTINNNTSKDTARTTESATSVDTIKKAVAENKKVPETNSVKSLFASEPTSEMIKSFSFNKKDGIRVEGAIPTVSPQISANINGSLKNRSPGNTTVDSEYLARSANAVKPVYTINNINNSNPSKQNNEMGIKNMNQTYYNHSIGPIYSNGDRSVRTFSNDENTVNDLLSRDLLLSKINRNQENTPEGVNGSKQDIIPNITGKNIEYHSNAESWKNLPKNPQDKRAAPPRESPNRKKSKKNNSKEQLINSVRSSRTTLETLLGPETLNTNGNTFEKFHQFRPPSPKEFHITPSTANFSDTRIYSTQTGQRIPVAATHPASSHNLYLNNSPPIKQEEEEYTIPAINHAIGESNNRVLSTNDVVKNNPFIFNPGMNPIGGHINQVGTENNAYSSNHHNTSNQLPLQNPFTYAYTVKKENTSPVNINPLPKKKIPKALKKMSDMVSKYNLGES